MNMDELKAATDKLADTMKQLGRTFAVMRMSRPNNPYYPLARVMAKLKLFHDGDRLFP